MQQESKPLDPPEKSLKYIAWSLKEMSENVKKITSLMEEYLITQRQARGAPSQSEMPF